MTDCELCRRWRERLRRVAPRPRGRELLKGLPWHVRWLAEINAFRSGAGLAALVMLMASGGAWSGGWLVLGLNSLLGAYIAWRAGGRFVLASEAVVAAVCLGRGGAILFS